MLNRRSLIIGLGALLAAPAIVKAESLMKVVAQKDIWTPKTDFAFGNSYAWFKNEDENAFSILLGEMTWHGKSQARAGRRGLAL